MEGVRSSAFLDQSLRAEPVYGLTEYAPVPPPPTVWRNRREGGSGPLRPVLCAARRGGQPFPTITVDARTGAVQEVFSYAPGMEEGGDTGPDPGGGAGQSGDVPVRPLRRAVEALTLYDGRGARRDRRPYYTFTYVQQAAFPSRRTLYRGHRQRRRGSVYRLDYQYDEDDVRRLRRYRGETAALAAWARRDL